MPIFKENDTAIRIETPHIEVVELSKIKGDRASLQMQRDQEVDRHTSIISGIDSKISVLDTLLSTAEALGVKDVADENIK